jgi:hypothetical protein
MGKFRIQRTQRGLTPASGSVRAGFDPTTNAGAVGAAVGEAAVAIGRGIKRRSEKKEALRQAIEAKDRQNLDVLEKKKEKNLRADTEREIENIKFNTDPEMWDNKINETIDRFSAESGQFNLSDQARAELQIDQEGWAEFQRDTAVLDRAKRNRVSAIDETKESLTDLFRTGDKDKIAQMTRIHSNVLRRNGVTSEETSAIIKTAKEAGNELFKTDSIEGLKPLLVNTAEGVGKEAALLELRNGINDLIKDGTLTSVEGTEADKILGDWLDNFVAGRERKAKDAIKLTTTETYNNFMPLAVGGDLTFNDIEESKMLKVEKEKWKKYIKGSYADAPRKTTGKGQSAAFGAVYRASTLALSPTEAYDVLLDERFTKRSMTNAEFEWAVDKINNPYKKYTLENIKTVRGVNASKVNKGFNTASENQRLVDVNDATVQWVDDQIASGKTPTLKEIGAMASQFRVAGGTLVDVGQVIKKGGVEWEVIGFDDDGEPIVEVVE